MNILDKIASWIDRREVKKLRETVAENNAVIDRQAHIINQQASQVANANARWLATTDKELEFRREIDDLKTKLKGYQDAAH